MKQGNSCILTPSASSAPLLPLPKKGKCKKPTPESSLLSPLSSLKSLRDGATSSLKHDPRQEKVRYKNHQ